MLLLVVNALGCGAVHSEGSDPVIPTVAPVAAGFAPISYHVSHCGDCHGPYGQQHDLARIRAMSLDDLTDVTRQMTEGHGNMPIEENELTTLVRWQRAMAGGEAFVSVDAIASDLLVGDISPGAKVQLLDGSVSVPGTVQGHRFRIPLQSPLTESARLRVQLGGRTQDHPISPVGN
jgi:hypothetical protein